ncbi:MAG: N-acetyltransferase [Actinomycetota bacterium]|nr:N-acetyltransferase [Actinomycetota bacterium]
MNGITNGATTFRFWRFAVPSGGVEPLPISGLLLRRAVLGTLLAVRRPLSPSDLAAALAAAGVTTCPNLTKGPSRVIADLLAHQVRIGKVAKVGPALFAVLPGSMSRSTRQRCLRWQREVARLRAEVADFPPRIVAAGSPLSDATDVTVPDAPNSLGSPLSDTLRLADNASERGDPTRPSHPQGQPAAACASERAEQAHNSACPDGRHRYSAPMFTIASATIEDLDVLVEQGGALFVEDAGRYDTFIDFTWSGREGRADFERLIASDDCLVLVASNDAGVVAHLVGYIHDASPTRHPVTYANLRSLYVAPETRRQGVGDRLTRSFVDWARAKGCAEAHVDAYAGNEPAQRLYELHGFVVRSTARALTL